MTIEYTGAGGVRHNYGPLLSPATKPDGAGAVESVAGNVRQLEYHFAFNGLPTNSTSDAVVPTIPAYAAITKVHLFVLEAFVGGTSIEVGTWTPAGVAVDADGLIPAAVGVTANLALGNVIGGRGAQVVEGPDAAGTAHIDGDGVYVASATGPISSVASQIRAVAVGTFTAGRARLFVEYIDPAG